MEVAEVLIHRKLDIVKEDFITTGPSFSLVDMEKELIKNALNYVQIHNLNIEDASQLLGIGRATLFRKIAKYQIDT
jgi:transcriptional regulator of acetoin/glycerol metabolism